VEARERLSPPVRFLEGVITPDEADALLKWCRHQIPWEAGEVVVFGKRHPIPRRHCWFAPAGVVYRWSGTTMEPNAMPDALKVLTERLHEQLGVHFPTALANLYRDGSDRMGWHRDDEALLGPKPPVVSLSLGASRDFKMRPRGGGPAHTLPLLHGSVLLMEAGCQDHWEHALPPRKRVHGPRVNLTFRPLAQGAGDTRR